MDRQGDTPDETPPKPDQPDHVASSFETPDSELPSLPVTDTSECLTDAPGSSQLDNDTSALVEKDMKRKLMDMEPKLRGMEGEGDHATEDRRAA